MIPVMTCVRLDTMEMPSFNVKTVSIMTATNVPPMGLALYAAIVLISEY